MELLEFCFSRETFGRMNVDRQSIFLAVPGSLRIAEWKYALMM